MGHRCGLKPTSSRTKITFGERHRMSDLGQWLREAREARGLSLAEVEEATRIRQAFLSALEADDWSSLPNEVVGRGFLRNYARFLGLDPDELVARRAAEQAEAAEAFPIVSQPRPVDYRPIDFDLKLGDSPRRPWRWWSATGLVLVILAIIAWWLAVSRPGLLVALGPQPTATPMPTSIAQLALSPTWTPAPTATPTVPAVSPTAGVFVLPTPTPTPEPTDIPTPVLIEAASDQEIRVTTRIVDRAWLRVVVDGQVLLETILEPGDEREWVGKQTVTVRSGNAGGVVIVLEGQELGVMGEPGQVVERTWAWLDGRIVEQEPTVTAEGSTVGGGAEPIVNTPTPLPTPTPAG